MSTIVRLEPPLWFHTPRGRARAFFLIDGGVDQDLMWVCFQYDGPQVGECWTYSNWDIRIMSNQTVGMITKSPWEVGNDRLEQVLDKRGASRGKPVKERNHAGRGRRGRANAGGTTASQTRGRASNEDGATSSVLRGGNDRPKRKR